MDFRLLIVDFLISRNWRTDDAVGGRAEFGCGFCWSRFRSSGRFVALWAGGEEADGSEDMEMRVEDQIIAESVDGGDGSKFAIGKIEASAEGVAEGFGGGVEEVAEELAALAEDAS